MAPLGERQIALLHSLNRAKYPGGGWEWSTQSETLTILESLHKRGLADFEPRDGYFSGTNRRPYGTYTINAAGLAVIQPELDRRKALDDQRRAERMAEQEVADAADRVLDETLERIRPQLAELGIHPDTVVAVKHGRRGLLMPAETVETLIRYALEGEPHA